MNKFYKKEVIIPIVIGAVVGGLLFIFGEITDAPGICVIGISIAFILTMLGINKTGIIKKGLLSPILLLFFAIFFALITTSILLEGEFDNKPENSAYGYIFATALLLIGLVRLRIYKKNN